MRRGSGYHNRVAFCSYMEYNNNRKEKGAAIMFRKISLSSYEYVQEQFSAYCSGSFLVQLDKKEESGYRRPDLFD